jgi:hypothetical protein
MASLAIAVKTKNKERKIVVEIDADKFEKIAASFGFFNPDFVTSLERAEADFQAGRVTTITSLKDAEA